MEEGKSASGVLHSPMVTKLAVAFLVVATLLVGAQALKALMNLDTPPQFAGNIITVEGTGKVTAVPDVATVSFTVSENGDTASQAQEVATKKSNVALDVIRELGIDDEDIKTTSYNLSPRYSYQQPCYGGYCPVYEESRIIGYSVSQTVEVKIRDLDQVGKVLSSLGDAGVSNLYGPNFIIDNEDELRAEAREEAIKEARAKAKTLAKDLNVRLVRIVNFWESTGPSYPIYYAKDGFGFGGAAESAVAPSPEIPAGENEIVVSVSIGYEIR